MIRTILCLAAGLLLWPAGAAAVEPREVAGQVAATIEREYFDPARGAEIASGLRQEAARGDFDRIRDPLELATALTDRLRPQDRHFNVRWSAAGGNAADRRLPLREDAAKTNFGIRRVEVQPGNVGYLDLRYFADFEQGAATPPARVAIDAALGVLANVDALVIDLRDNGGGSPAMVGYLASAFVAPGADIYNSFRRRADTRSEAPAHPHPAPRTGLPLYILTSGRTGSAAEAFAYTLKNARRATVVGETTGGAANPGRPFPLDDGFSVFVPVGTPVSPITGGNWEGTGVAPDVEAVAADALAVARQRALATLVERGTGGDAVRWSLEAMDAAPATPPATLAPLAGAYGALQVELVDGALQLRQDRRPPLRLRPLSADLFHIADEPTRRVRFDRADGEVAALELLWADGNVARHPRGAGAAH